MPPQLQRVLMGVGPTLHKCICYHKDKIQKRNLDQYQMISTQFGRIKYVPFACDTFGGWTTHSEELILRIAEELSIVRSRPRAECVHAVKSRLSMAIMKGVAVCLVIRNIDARLNYENTDELLECGLSEYPDENSELSDEENGLIMDLEVELD